MNIYEVLEVDDSEFGSFGFVVADSAAEAKKIAWKAHPDVDASYDGEWVRMRVKLKRKADASGLKKGWYDHSKDSLRRGIINCMYEADDRCDKCEKLSTVLTAKDGMALCGDCDNEND